MQVDGHAPAVVLHFNGTVTMKYHADAGSVPGERLIDTVVDDLLGEVVRPRGIGIHTGTLTYRIEP